MISHSTSKGKHTTVTVYLRFDIDTSVIDTPGIGEIDPYGIREEDKSLSRICSVHNKCKFNTCTHDHEPAA